MTNNAPSRKACRSSILFAGVTNNLLAIHISFANGTNSICNAGNFYVCYDYKLFYAHYLYVLYIMIITYVANSSKPDISKSKFLVYN